MPQPKRQKNNAQSIIEYAAIIIVILAAFLAMGTYYKRSLMGKYRQAGETLSSGGLYNDPDKGYTDRKNPYVEF